MFIAIWTVLIAAGATLLVWLGLRRRDDVVMLAEMDRRKAAKQVREGEAKAAHAAQGKADEITKKLRMDAHDSANDDDDPHDLSGPADAIKRARGTTKAKNRLD